MSKQQDITEDDAFVEGNGKAIGIAMLVGMIGMFSTVSYVGVSAYKFFNKQNQLKENTIDMRNTKIADAETDISDKFEETKNMTVSYDAVVEKLQYKPQTGSDHKFDQ